MCLSTRERFDGANKDVMCDEDDILERLQKELSKDIPPAYVIHHASPSFGGSANVV